MREVKRRTEIKIETHKLTIIRTRRGKTDSAFCKNCQQNVSLLTREQAALIFQTDIEFLQQLIEQADQIHPVGENAICADSLIAYFKREIRFVED